MRREGWEDRYLDALERHAQQPGEYGKSDCFMMAMDIAQECVDRELKYHFEYTNVKEAQRVMAEHGWHDVGQAFASYFREIPPAFAGRGDIGVVVWDEEMCGVVVVGADVVGKHPTKGIARLPRSALVRAFRVE